MYQGWSPTKKVQNIFAFTFYLASEKKFSKNFFRFTIEINALIAISAKKRNLILNFFKLKSTSNLVLLKYGSAFLRFLRFFEIKIFKLLIFFAMLCKNVCMQLIKDIQKIFKNILN